jgi:hypothetical protein
MQCPEAAKTAFFGLWSDPLTAKAGLRLECLAEVPFFSIWAALASGEACW